MRTPTPNRNPNQIRVSIVDRRPLVVMGFAHLVQTRGAAMTLAWAASSVEEACIRMNEARPDVIIVSVANSSSLDEAVSTLSSRVPLLVLLDGPDHELQDRAIVMGARGVIDLGNGADLIVRAIQKVEEGEIWLDRAAASRILGRASHPDTSDVHGAPPLEHLTDREQKVLAAVTSNPDLGARQIGERLGITESTLRNHLTSIYGKLGVSSRVELLAYSHRHGLTGTERAA